jgi:hypothetical protein
MGFQVAESSAVYGARNGVGSAAREGASGAQVSPAQGSKATPRLENVRLSGPIPECDRELGQEIKGLSRWVGRANHRMLQLIAAFDRRGAWKAGGHRSCAHWLHVETDLSLGAAREKVRTARALTAMPLTSQAMKRGELSYSKVRAMTRAVTDVPDAQAEAQLVARAKRQTTAQVEQMIRGFKHLGGRVEEAELERRRHAARYLSIRPDGNGMYQLRGTLPAEVGALLMRAVEAASDALFREEWSGSSREDGAEVSKARRSEGLQEGDAGRAGKKDSGGSREKGPAPAAEKGSADSREETVGSSQPRQPKLTPSQRRADAIGLVAERAMAAGFGGGGAATADNDDAGPAHSSAWCGCDAAPLSGTRAERYQVFLHVDPGTLQAEGEIGRSHLEDGTRVSAETSRRLSCDAAVVQVTTDGDGSVLDVGRRTRTIPPALRRALQVRDGGCRFPGCGLRFTEGHHLVHWADGGETTLDNLVLLCRFHHRRVHEDGFEVRRGSDGGVRFFDPEGRAVPPGERAIIRRDRAIAPRGQAI